MDETGSTLFGGGFLLAMFALVVIMIAAIWKVFTKAGRPGWACIVPIYNMVVLFRIAGKPGWWVLLAMIPLVNIVILFLAYIALARSFGKGAGFGVGLVLLSPIFFLILGFGDARYQHPPSAVPAQA